MTINVLKANRAHELAEEIRTRMHMYNFSQKEMHQMLKEKGYNVTLNSLRNWIRGDKKCELTDRVGFKKKISMYDICKEVLDDADKKAQIQKEKVCAH